MILNEDFDRFLAADLRRTTYIGHMTEAARLDRECRPSCGNCYFWMKTRDCPREARGQKQSMSGAACGLFNEAPSVARLRTKASEERLKAMALLQLT